jgi:hypothetical protein
MAVGHKYLFPHGTCLSKTCAPQLVFDYKRKLTAADNCCPAVTRSHFGEAMRHQAIDNPSK